MTEEFQQRVMELMSDPLFTKNMGKALPQAEPYKALGDGFGNISGQAFPEMCSCLCQNPEVFGPQGEPLFRFSEDQPRDAHGQWTSSGTSQSGDVKHTEYKGANRTIVVDHDTKANKITIKHLDAQGNLMVQQTHDSVGAARKELTVNGIDHKFYALRSEQRADDEGGEWITIHGAHVFIKDGVIEKGPEGFVGKTPQEIGSSSSNGTAGPPPLATWTSGASSACSRMRNEAKKDIEEGRADSNALVVACRKDDLTGEAHRGIAVPETSGVLKYKVGDEIQLMPQSFSYDKGIAQNFAKSEKDIHNDKFILHPDKTGPRWESVMFHVSASGAKGWNIGSNTKYKVHDEAEVVMQGRYRVTGVKHWKKGYDFALEQIGTF